MIDRAPLRQLPTGQRRALARADDGKTLSADEAAELLSARGAALDALCAIAARVRDTAHGDRVTYSHNVFVPLTHLCRDACGYCTFAQPPAADQPAFLSIEEVVDLAEAGRQAGCTEALFTLGDAPEARWRQAREWLEARGYHSTLDYLRAAAIAVIERTGLLPHLNPGVMSWSALNRLKPAAASMGLMLESTAERLLQRGQAHAAAHATKDPSVRLRTLDDAGRLSIPFTSGLLIGIGETLRERADTLLALAASAKRYGHLQEVIVQNFRAKPHTAMAGSPEPGFDELRAAVAVARLLLPVRVHVQAPPNLSPDGVEALIGAGIDDWGGVSLVTADHVNPEYAWPHVDELAQRTAAAGKQLVERLCVHPRWATRPDPWIAGRMRAPLAALAGDDGLAGPDAVAQPQPWQDPEPTATPAGDDGRWHADQAGVGVDAVRRDTHRGDGLRADADDVYGDTDAVAAAHLRGDAAGRDPRALSPSGDGANGVTQRSGAGAPAAEIKAILGRAIQGQPPTEAETEVLLGARGTDQAALTAAADEVCRARVGETVTYVINRNINFTNVCYTGCRFCAFAQRRDDPDAYTLSLSQVADRAEAAWAYGATEVCLQGGIHPDYGGEVYFDLLDAVRERVPGLHVHAFSPMEVANGAARCGVSVRDWLARAKAHGLGSIPGTAAEILDDDVRWVLTKGKLPADAWIEVVTEAHALGLPSSSTMMYGHVDQPRHWAAHLHLLRRLQAESGGFTEFVALPFVHQQAPLYLAGHARPGPSWDDSVNVHAVARLVLQGEIDNIQLSWVKIGTQQAVTLLNAGCNDLGGTLMEETISRMAGADHGTRQDPETLRAIAEAAGRPAAERSTDYTTIAPAGIRYRVPA